MKSKYIASVCLILLTINCAENPFTGKKTMAFVQDSTLLPMSFNQYNEVLKESTVVTGTPESEMITRVGERITSAANKWLSANGYPDYDKDYKWEYKLIKSDQLNAWCMPGGKVAFYTGILPVAKGETGVAVIMGHEIAHALANHGQQRMSAGMIQQGAAAVGNVALSEKEEQQQIFNVAFGAGSQVLGMLPFSRKHETEADKIGLTLMAIAGYNPDEASELWKRMKAASGGKAPPEFLSTHPSNDTRIENLNNWASEAKVEAKKYGVTTFK